MTEGQTSPLHLVLGIDAGGTYTDAVLYEAEGGQVLSKSKALTTKADLTLGIVEAVDNLDSTLFPQVNYVAVSTTFATNALVEDKGGNVALVVLPSPGFDDQMIEHEPKTVLNGQTGIKGNVIEGLDEDRTRDAIQDLLAHGDVGAFAVSGYASVRNPAHELEARSIVRELCDRPVVCGHELASSLGFVNRANTAIWNARLLPLIRELLESIRRSLALRHLEAPLMVVKGDGTLMSEAVAMERPIETILSGPAASIIGAKKLANVEEATIVDMGGTTTDIAKIKDGRPEVNEMGAMVGRWRTSVSAADVLTSALGGDSRVGLDKNRQLQIGPRRVVPLCTIGSEYPEILSELETMLREYEHTEDAVAPEFLIYVKNGTPGLKDEENRILSILQDRPWPRHRLSEKLGKVHPSFLNTERLERTGSIQAASVTPTDALHAQGKFDLWCRKTAEAGVRLLAHHRAIGEDEMAQDIVDAVRRRLTLAILRKQLNHSTEGHEVPGCEVCEELLETLFDSGARDYRASLSLRHPVVAIGAPVEAYFPPLGETLGAEIAIPDHAEVANAVGAAAADVFVEVECLVLPGVPAGYILHTPKECLAFEHLPPAIEYAKGQVDSIARERAKAEGGRDAVPEVEVVEESTTSRNGQPVFLETRVRARITTAPAAGV